MLQPGETASITFEIPVDMLNFTGSAGKRIVEPGEFEVQVGFSCEDIRQTACVQVTGETQILPCHWRMLSCSVLS